MSSTSNPTISRLLQHWGGGDRAALDQLLERVQHQLRLQARAFLIRERPDHTLQPTALVNEVFLKLVRQRNVRWNDREHFFAVAAMTMRRVLVDAARKRQAARRGGELLRVSLHDGDLAEQPDLEVLALHSALEDLAQLDPRQAKIVTMRYFGGLSVPAVAKALSLSVSTVEADWRMARAWLRTRLEPQTA